MTDPPRFAAWQPATHCIGKAGSGARALMLVLLLVSPGTTSWGIYNCRRTALGNLSAHAEGRALDVGCGLTVGHKLVATLLRLGPWRLGISCIIHDRRIYSAKSPNGRAYSGVPHRDHVHIEMTRKAAANLTVARAKRVLGVL